MSGAAFVTQEERVIAHLFWAVVSVEQVTRLSPGAPSQDGCWRLIRMLARWSSVTPGQTIPERALRGQGGPGEVRLAERRVQFKSQLLEVGPAKWMIAIPRDIHRSDRRMIERIDCHSSRRNTVQVVKPDGTKRTLLVHDISPAGIGVVFDPKLDAFEEGQVLRGELHMLGHDTVNVRFEVVSVHSLESDPSQRMLGCRFVGLGFSGASTSLGRSVLTRPSPATSAITLSQSTAITAAMGILMRSACRAAVVASLGSPTRPTSRPGGQRDRADTHGQELSGGHRGAAPVVRPRRGWRRRR